MRHVAACLIGLTLALGAGAAAAQTLQQDKDWCYSPSATDAQTIEGCTAMIESGQGTQAERADYFDARAYGYDDEGRYDEAIADESRAIALRPDDANAYNTRCTVYNHEKRFDQAISDCSEAIALKPDFGLAYEGRGKAYRSLGAIDKAIADYQTAARLNPSRSQPRDALSAMGATP